MYFVGPKIERHIPEQKLKFSIKDFFSKCDQVLAFFCLYLYLAHFIFKPCFYRSNRSQMFLKRDLKACNTWWVGNTSKDNRSSRNQALFFLEKKHNKPMKGKDLSGRKTKLINKITNNWGITTKTEKTNKKKEKKKTYKKQDIKNWMLVTFMWNLQVCVYAIYAENIFVTVSFSLSFLRR